MRKRQLVAIAAISLEENGNGPFVIKKSIDPSNSRTFSILPASDKEAVQNIANGYQISNENTKDYLRYNASGEHIKAHSAITEALECAKLAIACERIVSSRCRQFNLSGSTYSLKNLNENLLLIAKEKITRKGKTIYNYWFTEYIPGKSSNTWELK